ncbi:MULTISPECIES: aldehyde dehydrogenase family protein [Marivita]|jgi:acyl-CoA reductase-like NAD-dependent aldehyde dehydrogenase|uniref:Aldehyde dehydrogenase family protein n=1 Tax=Marivita cryptomonadis TaxID=505252 RepID=A0A9Q2P6K3_9RHOB|nr:MULTISPECIES: aldehyde dehydrogenase family protein [Marivita]MBM2323204.1 aldehyde dehydrogenase family protein [Marivita cryptomonadis]MBM2332788.1 aldehyde dehydrogenase family protein [Marivita cryptomonadis]MBM2342370.1 aldehyde dehydrogenase family protein [Marivita cryptomonadis]MBM2347037.1 aldehyde dehydrogenase family protein [Marivita cryptomonadis]MBM2351714.1 aldehyde dehydrogenase family protein [Marivita cryptomonadis]
MNVKANISSDIKVDYNGPYVMSIGGRLVGANQTFDVYNPATGEVIANAPEATPEQVEEAIAAAKDAQPGWAALSWEERSAYLTAYADALDAHKEEIITLLTTEQGKPRHSMATVEVEYAIYWVREVAKRKLEDEVIEDTPEHIVKVAHTPLGVVGAITPWNFPILLGLWKVAPCLITGNTMVMKPSPYTPLGTLKFGEIAQKVLPAGVLNVISGGNAQGAWITEHKDVNKISFTGSTATGKKVMAASSGTLKRVTLELGGNDPAILMPNTDYKPLIPSLFDAAFGNSGQWCIAIKRLYVHDSIYDQFLKDFVAYASDKVVGDGMDPNTDLGPIQNKMQYGKLLDMFADVKANGCKIALGGEIDVSLPGNFVPITIVDNPPRDSRIVREEPFGPILPLVRWTDLEDVIADANNTDFGLAASVWGPDRDKAIEVANRIEAGTVWVNEIHIHGIDIPFGGHKQSGMGVENGKEGLQEFTNTKTYMFKK